MVKTSVQGLIMAISKVISDIISIAEKSAPLIGTVLGSPLAGVGLSLLASVFGANPASPEDILSKMQADPDAALKIRQLELQNQVTLEQIASNNFKIQTDDTANARDREEDVLKITGKFDWVQHACAIIAVVGFFIVIALVFMTSFDKNDHDVLYMMVGVLGGTFTTIYSYYFGSSIKK